MLVTWAKSYLCESVLVQKTLAEPGVLFGPWGCSQCVPVMGVTERPVSVTSQGSVSAEGGVRASTLWAKHRIKPPSLVRGDRGCGYRLQPLWCVARSCEDNGVHSNQMKSLAVPARSMNRASAVHKAKPKGPVMRRIREAVSGSADLRDGSRAVVTSRWFGKRNAKPF